MVKSFLKNKTRIILIILYALFCTETQYIIFCKIWISFLKKCIMLFEVVILKITIYNKHCL